jgi:hypothetical protein
MVSREPDLFFKKLIEDIPKIIKWKMSDTEWSKEIFGYLADLGKKEGFDVFYENNPYEYLLDMCWVYAKDTPAVNWIEVAFEVEWSRDLDSIIDEFSKLVDIKAYTKVLLCYPKVDEIDDLLSTALEMIRYNPFRFPEEHYLIVVLSETRKRFIFSGFVIDSIGNCFPQIPKEFPK